MSNDDVATSMVARGLCQWRTMRLNHATTGAQQYQQIRDKLRGTAWCAQYLNGFPLVRSFGNGSTWRVLIKRRERF